MTDQTRLTRRAVLAGGAALTVPAAATEVPPASQSTPADSERITLGKNTFLVPRPYLFGEILPPGTNADGLPALFSFAFTFPNGAPAGEGLEFPPMSHPFVLERPDNQFLVMCYRVSVAGPEALHKAPGALLANSLLETDRMSFSAADGGLAFHPLTNTDIENRYLSFQSEKHRSFVQALLLHIDHAQFFYGTVEFEKPSVRAVVYIPEEQHVKLVDALSYASELLMEWKV